MSQDELQKKLKEKFMNLESYEEFDERRSEFEELRFDKDIINHFGKIAPVTPNQPFELSKTPGGTIGR